MDGLVIGVDINSNSTGVAILNRAGTLVDFDIADTSTIEIRDYVMIATMITNLVCSIVSKNGGSILMIVIEDAKLGFRGAFNVTILTRMAMIIACVRGILSERVGLGLVTCVPENTARSRLLKPYKKKPNTKEGIKVRCIDCLKSHCSAENPVLLDFLAEKSYPAQGDIADAFIVASWWLNNYSGEP